MTGEKLVDEIYAQLRKTNHTPQRVRKLETLLREAGAALSSPCPTCEGREPVDECGAAIYDVRGGTARASAHITVRGENLKEGQVLHCLVFLPTEKTGT